MSKNKKKNVQSVSTEASNSKLRKTLLFVIALVAIVLYANTLSHGWAFDDTVVITGNQFTQKGIAGIPDLLTKDLFSGIYGKALELSGGRYRPLTLVMFAIEYEFFGANPAVGHFMNLAFFTLCCIVIFITVEALLKKNMWAAFISALLFAAHPIHTEVTANIKSRDEIVCLIGLCLTLYFILKHIETSKNNFLYFGLTAYFLSLLSKENGITFLFIIPLTLYCFTSLQRKEIIQRSIPYFITAALFVMIRSYFVGFIGDRSNTDIMENPFVNSGFGEKTATIMFILWKYVWLLFFPHPLSSDYSFNQIPFIGWTNLKAIVPFLLYAAGAIWSIRILIKKDEASTPKIVYAYSILFFISTIFLVSNLVFNIGAPMGERFLFTPSFAFCLAGGIALTSIFKLNTQSKLPTTALFLFTVITVVYGFKTIDRNKDWQSNLTLFAADVKTVPNSAKAAYYYGNTLISESGKEKKLTPKKIEMLQIAKGYTLNAARINPKFHHAFYNLGLIYQELGNGDSAIYFFNKVLELQPTHILTQGAIGSSYGKLKGDFDKAIFYLKRAVEYNPNDAGSFENLGIAYAMKGQTDEAIKTFEHAIALNPKNAQTYLNIGVAWHNKGDQQKCDAYMNKAYELDPSLKPQTPQPK